MLRDKFHLMINIQIQFFTFCQKCDLFHSYFRKKLAFPLFTMLCGQVSSYDQHTNSIFHFLPKMWLVPLLFQENSWLSHFQPCHVTGFILWSIYNINFSLLAIKMTHSMTIPGKKFFFPLFIMLCIAFDLMLNI